jgi:hypothetical protein
VSRPPQDGRPQAMVARHVDEQFGKSKSKRSMKGKVFTA